MAQILRPRHPNPLTPQTRPQIPNRHTLHPPPHQHVPNHAPGAPARPRPPHPALPTGRPAQRSAHARLTRAQERALADGLRAAAQRRARRLEPRARAVGLCRDGARCGGGARGACRRRGAYVSVCLCSAHSTPRACVVSLPDSYSLPPPDRVYPASDRVVRPSTTRRARMAIIPRARHAHLLLASSAPRRTQRRACALQLDYLYHPNRCRRINTLPVLIRVSEERSTLPAHVASALRDA